jgi:hypothetical protein
MNITYYYNHLKFYESLQDNALGAKDTGVKGQAKAKRVCLPSWGY